MTTIRSAKRQKLDQNHDSNLSSKSSPALATTNHGTPVSTAPGDGASLTSPGMQINSSPQQDGPKLSSREIWRQAKAMSRDNRILKRAQTIKKHLDIYDDIEGANSSRGAIDQLRHQGVETPASSKKHSTSLGFFKKFARERVGSSETPTITEIDHTVSQPVQSSGPADIEDHEDPLRRVYGGPDRPDHPNRLRREAESATKAQKHAERPVPAVRWVYGQPKKTFEDEIRELEESARKQAEGNSDDELARPQEDLRPGTRSQGPRRTNAAAKASKPIKSGPTPVRTKPLDRRKRKADQGENEDVADKSGRGKETAFAKRLKTMTPVLRAEVVLEDQEAEQVSNPEKAMSQISPTTETTSSAFFDATHLACIQKVVMEKLTARRPIAIAELETEYSKVSSVITQTVTAGESNSMLLVGARGIGKTALVNQILREQAVTHADDFHVVRLNGFIHTDDKIALREIWRQLGRERELDEEESTSQNYADTMSRLLALLSHSAAAADEAESDGRVTKSIIFVLDEFELFASHPRQTLLYNLFDVAQSRKAPIAVLGLTTRIDVVESLEKRVKSRFSHRSVHLSPPRTFDSFRRICSGALALSCADLRAEEKAILASSSDDDVRPKWNETVQRFLLALPCDRFLRRVYHTTKSVPEIFASWTMSVATLPTSSSTSSSALLDHFISSFASYSPSSLPGSNLDLLTGLSGLQRALLVCAARLTAIHAADTVSFPLAYEEYRTLAAKAKLQASASGAATSTANRACGREVARRAWEDLVECGLVLSTDGKAGTSAGKVDVGLEELGACGRSGGIDLGGWGKWCREI